MTRDPYEVLGVPRDADATTIKKTFRRLARELHPDVNRHEADAEERFKEVAEAYEILSDEERRAVYDRYGHQGLSSRGFHSAFQGFGSFGDIFDAFFGGDPFGSAFTSGGRRGAVQGGDVAVEVEIELADAANGTQVDVEYDAVEQCERCEGRGAEPGSPIETCNRCGGAGQLQSVARTAFGQLVRTTVCDACGGTGEMVREPCADCAGRGRRATRRRLAVDIPAGISDEQRIRLSARGHAGERGGPAGDLYVLVRVTPDPRFVRDGNHLISVLDVPATQAALGGTLSVQTLDGDEQIEIEPGTQPGTIITLSGRGMPSLGRGRRGDQQVVVNVLVPRALSDEQRELVERLDGTLVERNLREPEEEGLLSKVKRALR